MQDKLGNCYQTAAEAVITHYDAGRHYLHSNIEADINRNNFSAKHAERNADGEFPDKQERILVTHVATVRDVADVICACEIPLGVDVMLVHGEPSHTRPPFVPYGHAWVEYEDNGVEMVYDTESGMIIPRSIYYSVGKIDPDQCIRYTNNMLNWFLQEHDHWGPWKKADEPVVVDAEDEKEKQMLNQQYLKYRRYRKHKYTAAGRYPQNKKRYKKDHEIKYPVVEHLNRPKVQVVVEEHGDKMAAG